MTFHFRKVEVRSGSGLDQFVGIMEKVKAKVEETATDGFRIDEQMFFL